MFTTLQEFWQSLFSMFAKVYYLFFKPSLYFKHHFKSELLIEYILVVAALTLFNYLLYRIIFFNLLA